MGFKIWFNNRYIDVICEFLKPYFSLSSLFQEVCIHHEFLNIYGCWYEDFQGHMLEKISLSSVIMSLTLGLKILNSICILYICTLLFSSDFLKSVHQCHLQFTGVSFSIRSWDVNILLFSFNIVCWLFCTFCCFI